MCTMSRQHAPLMADAHFSLKRRQATADTIASA